MISNSTAGALLQRGISYVRQLSSSSDAADSGNIGRTICEQLLLEDEDSENENLPGSDEEIIFGPIGTPKSSRVIG